MSWAELIAIRDEARRMAREDADKPLVDCPNDGTRLVFNAKRRAWGCPSGDFTRAGGPSGPARQAGEY